MLQWLTYNFNKNYTNRSTVLNKKPVSPLQATPVFNDWYNN